MPYVEWTEDMGEISGFGGGYEAACRAMVKAGVEWCEANPDKNPQFHGYKNVYGVCMEDNEDAKELSKAIVSATEGASGAMHQAAVSHVLAFRRLGAEAYCQQLRDREKNDLSSIAPMRNG